MKAKEELKRYREMKPADLEKELTAVSNKAQMAVLQIKAGKSTNVAEISKLRHSIARLKTIIRENQKVESQDE